MRVALLSLAYSERIFLGFVTSNTRSRLLDHGIGSVALEQYFSIIGVN
jgi:hypothetical protein